MKSMRKTLIISVLTIWCCSLLFLAAEAKPSAADSNAEGEEDKPVEKKPMHPLKKLLIPVAPILKKILQRSVLYFAKLAKATSSKNRGKVEVKKMKSTTATSTTESSTMAASSYTQDFNAQEVRRVDNSFDDVPTWNEKVGSSDNGRTTYYTQDHFASAPTYNGKSSYTYTSSDGFDNGSSRTYYVSDTDSSMPIGATTYYKSNDDQSIDGYKGYGRTFNDGSYYSSDW